MSDSVSARPGGEEGGGIWFGRGARVALSLPALILASAFIGFAGLARDAGLSLVQTLFMILVVWALPAKVVLVGAIISGNSLPAAAFAAALSSARLTPMVVSLTPELRGPRTPNWLLYVLSHFVAVTSWVLAMERFDRVPRDSRPAFFAGISVTLMSINLAVVVVVFVLAAGLPPAFSAALFFLTPLYFLTSLWGSARERAGQVAMVFGIALGPAFHSVIPEFDILAAGVTGGLIAYGLHLLVRRRQGA